MLLCQRRSSVRPPLDERITVKTCWYCRREHDDKYVTCDGCRAKVRRTAAKKRAALRAADLCARCGRRRPRQGFDLCRRCAKYNADGAARRAAERLAQGLCPRCGLFPVEPGLTGCAACLEGQAYRLRLAKPWRKKRDTGLNERVAAYRRRQRALGNCVICGKPAGLNPRTGYAYAKCEQHRLLDIVRARRRRLRVSA